MSILDRLKQPADLDQHNLFYAIAIRVEEALAATQREDLGAAMERFNASLQTLLAQAPQEIRDAAQGRPTDPVIGMAYKLGQLDFAAHLLSYAYSVRAVDTFASSLLEPSTRPIVDKMREDETTLFELWRAFNGTMEVVKQVILHLQEIGAVDHRQRGRETVYGLTPAAKAVLDAS